MVHVRHIQARRHGVFVVWHDPAVDSIGDRMGPAPDSVPRNGTVDGYGFAGGRRYVRVLLPRGHRIRSLDLGGGVYIDGSRGTLAPHGHRVDHGQCSFRCLTQGGGDGRDAGRRGLRVRRPRCVVGAAGPARPLCAGASLVRRPRVRRDRTGDLQKLGQGCLVVAVKHRLDESDRYRARGISRAAVRRHLR